MKKALIAVMNDVISLLIIGSWLDQADWFAGKLTRIQVQKEGSKEFRATLREIQDRIAGMGSFSDLPMRPQKESGISKDEANRRKWVLAEELDEAIIAMLRRKRPTRRGRKRAKGKAK